MKRKLKYIFSIVIGLLLLLITTFLSNLTEFITFCLKLKLWEVEINEFIRLTIIIYAVPKIISLLKERRKEIMELFKIIKRNKITILGYLTIILVDLIILVITNVCLKYPEVANVVFSQFGLVHNGAVNEVAVYSAVAGLLAAITGVNFIATSKVGWETKKEHEQRVEEIEFKKTISLFIKEVNSRIDAYTSSDKSLSYSAMFINGIKMGLEDKEVIISKRSQIVQEFASNQDYQNILSREIMRIVVDLKEETISKPRENIKW